MVLSAIEVSNVDALLLLAICETGWDGAVEMVSRVLGTEHGMGDGEVILGGRPLKPDEIRNHLSAQLDHIHKNHLDKLLEIGVVVLDA